MNATAIVPPPLGGVDTDPATHRIAVNIRRELARQLRGTAAVLDASFRVRAGGKEGAVIYHPDVIVDAVEPDRGARLARVPKVVFEVATTGSERAVFIKKWSIHEKLPAAGVHALVDPERIFVTLHRRREDGGWQEETLTGANDSVSLPGIQCTLILEAIYREAMSSGDEGRI